MSMNVDDFGDYFSYIYWWNSLVKKNDSAVLFLILFSYHVLANVDAYLICVMHPFWDLSFFETWAAVRSDHDWLAKIENTFHQLINSAVSLQFLISRMWTNHGPISVTLYQVPVLLKENFRSIIAVSHVCFRATFHLTLKDQQWRQETSPDMESGNRYQNFFVHWKSPGNDI